MVQRWAMIKEGTVTNVCLWDGDESVWKPPTGIVMVVAPDNVGIGHTYLEGEWTAPVEPTEPIE